MNSFRALATILFALFACIATVVLAGGDKSARTTVITLAGGGEKHSGGYPIPVPVPVCTGGKSGGYGGGHYSHHSGHFGAQARMGWRR